MVKISIIVPVYKVEKYIKRCIESLIVQRFKDFEIILVDDGSPDECGSICEEYAKNDSRIVVIHKENGGVSSARNAGIEVAKGQYIWFVDADDWVEPNAIDNIWCEVDNKDVDLIVFGHNRMYDSKKIINGLSLEQYGIYNINLPIFFRDYYFTYKIGFMPWNKIYKKDVIKNYSLMFDTEEAFGEDLLFNLIYYLNIKNVFFSSGIYYNYYIRDGSAERTISKERHIQQMRLFEKFVEYVKQKGMSQEMKNYILPLLFFIHFTSGVNQVKKSGVKALELVPFLKSVREKEKFRNTFKEISFQKSLNQWLESENASKLARYRFNLFFLSCNFKMYNIAAIILFV